MRRDDESKGTADGEVDLADTVFFRNSFGNWEIRKDKKRSEEEEEELRQRIEKWADEKAEKHSRMREAASQVVRGGEQLNVDAMRGCGCLTPLEEERLDKQRRREAKERRLHKVAIKAHEEFRKRVSAIEKGKRRDGTKKKKKKKKRKVEKEERESP